MLIGDRIRAIREAKKLSQGDIEERSGLLRAYISRVENGHTVPAVETLEKIAQALKVPLYQLFDDGDEVPDPPRLPRSRTADNLRGSSGKEARELKRFCRALARMTEDRRLLLALAYGMVRGARC